MNKRQLGNSDLLISEMGLGCMSLGTDVREAQKTVEAALDSGINYLDTADLYDEGLNEEILGTILKGKRQELIVATKAGNRFEKGKEGWTWDPSKKHIQTAVKESLKRLQTDYIDLYQLHGGTIEDNIDETIEAFEELKQEGVIRYYGISSIRPNVIKEYVRRSSITSIMMQYSLLDRRAEDIFPLLEEHRISVVARGPVAKGILTDRPFHHMSDAIQQKGYLTYSSAELQTLRSTLENEFLKGRPLQAIALQYCLSSPVVASVVTGASNPAQVQDNVRALHTGNLTTEELDWLKNHTKKDLYQQHR